MIHAEDVFHIPFYKKEKFNGSYRKMNYRIEKKESDDSTVLLVTVWPGPYNFDSTEEGKKVTAEFEFSDQGLADAVAYLNQKEGAYNQ